MKNYVKHICIEGIDTSGKTTLALKVAEVLKWQYHHEGVPPTEGSLLEHYASLLLRNESTVFDRLHVGELAYAPVMRGQSRLSGADMKLMQRLIMATGTVIVICDPMLEVVINRWDSIDRAEYLKTQESFSRVWRRFHDFYSINCYHDEGDYPDPEKLIKVSQSLTTCPRDVVGSPSAKYLFVGERCNAKPEEFHLPFFSTSGSSGYLNERIAEAGFSEAEIAFTNALDVYGKEVDIHDKRQPNQTLIALGGVAHKILESQGLIHRTLRHPQYFKRFRSSQSDEYTGALRAIRESRDDANIAFV